MPYRASKVFLLWSVSWLWIEIQVTNFIYCLYDTSLETDSYNWEWIRCGFSFPLIVTLVTGQLVCKVNILFLVLVALQLIRFLKTYIAILLGSLLLESICTFYRLLDLWSETGRSYKNEEIKLLLSAKLSIWFCVKESKYIVYIQNNIQK